MKIYNFHPITKEYIGENYADESPLEKGVYLLPSFATFIAPPELGENQTAVFENDQWSIKQDFRGKIYYQKDTKAQIIIEKIGIYPDNNLTDIIPNEFDKWNYELNQWIEDKDLINRIQQEKINKESRQFLAETDWKVIRHKDQLDLNIQTSLTNEEYIELLQLRQQAREKVVEVL